MAMQFFSPTESMKMLSFIDEIMVPPSSFREQVLVSLAQIFGYDRTVFWREDETGSVLYDPIIHNVSESSINAYQTYYGELDLLHTRKVYHRIIKDNVLRISDVTTYNEYEVSEYYNLLAKQDNVYHEMAVSLLEGEKVLGSIVILRSKEEKDFNQKDVNRFRFLSKYLSKLLVNHNLYEDLEYQKSVFEQYANISSVGMFVFELPFTIRYFNPAAYEICSEQTSKANWSQPFPYFIEKHLLNNESLKWNDENEQTVTLPDLNDLTIQIIPFQNKRRRNEKMFAVYLFPQSQVLMHRVTGERGIISQLTKKEAEVCNFLKMGLPNEVIAKEMCVSVNTVKKHLQNIYAKVNVKNRTELCYFLK